MVCMSQFLSSSLEVREGARKCEGSLNFRQVSYDDHCVAVCPVTVEEGHDSNYCC